MGQTMKQSNQNESGLSRQSQPSYLSSPNQLIKSVDKQSLAYMCNNSQINIKQNLTFNEGAVTNSPLTSRRIAESELIEQIEHKTMQGALYALIRQFFWPSRTIKQPSIFNLTNRNCFTATQTRKALALMEAAEWIELSVCRNNVHLRATAYMLDSGVKNEQ